MTFAIIETGGKQYRVSEGTVLSIEKLSGAAEGGKVVFDRVLFVGSDKDAKIGAPLVTGAKVEGTVDAEIKNKKITVVKYKAKSNYYKKRGHRQRNHKVTITKIA